MSIMQNAHYCSGVMRGSVTWVPRSSASLNSLGFLKSVLGDALQSRSFVLIKPKTVLNMRVVTVIWKKLCWNRQYTHSINQLIDGSIDRSVVCRSLHFSPFSTKSPTLSNTTHIIERCVVKGLNRAPKYLFHSPTSPACFLPNLQSATCQLESSHNP